MKQSTANVYRLCGMKWCERVNDRRHQSLGVIIYHSQTTYIWARFTARITIHHSIAIILNAIVNKTINSCHESIQWIVAPFSVVRVTSTCVNIEMSNYLFIALYLVSATASPGPGIVVNIWALHIEQEKKEKTKCVRFWAQAIIIPSSQNIVNCLHKQIAADIFCKIPLCPAAEHASPAATHLQEWLIFLFVTRVSNDNWNKFN